MRRLLAVVVFVVTVVIFVVGFSPSDWRPRVPAARWAPCALAREPTGPPLPSGGGKCVRRA